jgi:membrane dipeptidase
MSFAAKKVIIIVACVMVALAIALGTALPLTVFRDNSKNDREPNVWKGSDVLDEVPLIDTHNDLPWNLYSLENNKLGLFDFNSNLKLNPRWQVTSSFTDIPRLR